MFWQKKLWMVKAIYSEDCLSKKVMVGMDDKTWKRFMFYVAPCGEHFFIVSERDSSEILHAIGDRCNFGLSQQSAKKLKFQPQGRWELVWMQNRHRSNTGEGLQSFQDQNKTRGKEDTDPILESRIWTDANAGFSSFTNIDSQVM